MTNEKFTVYDLETPANLFTAGFKDFETKKRKNFVIHESQNDLHDLIKFLRAIIRTNYTLVGYNCIEFDGQIIQYLLNNYKTIRHWSGEHVAERIHKLSQDIINLTREDKWNNLIPEWKMDIPHIDIFKQCHYDSKRISLKWLQFTMRFPNIESMPIHHTTRVDADQIPLVLGYMDNDVDSTAEFFKRIKFETDLRLTLSQEYGLNLLSASEPRMAREIFGKFLSEQMGVPYRELKERRTYRQSIIVKDIIFPYIKYRDPILKGVYDFFNGLQFNPYTFDQNNYNYQEGFDTWVNQTGYSISEYSTSELKTIYENYLENKMKNVKKAFTFHNISGDVGLGGIHGCVKPGVYDDDCTITEVDKVITIKGNRVTEDIDATSFYPLIGIAHDLFPEHLSSMFCKVYDDLFQMRQKIEKKNPINYIFKIILNSAYGLSKEPNNYFHDPKYTFSITINGQLLLLKLAEMLKEHVPGIVFYQFNTDGVTINYDPKYRDKVEWVKAAWSKNTNIPLENNFYKKMVIMDVNNYIAIDYKGKVKRKGLFGYSMDPEDKEMAYHKNPSALIIPKALEAYFTKGVDYKKFILEHKDIFDFCCGVKVNRDFDVMEYRYDKDTSSIIKQKIKQQVVRYYISHEHASLKKAYKEGSKMALKNAKSTGKKVNINKKKESNIVEIEKGWNTTYYNVHVEKPISEYGINYDYYISGVKNIIDQIEPMSNQIKLF